MKKFEQYFKFGMANRDGNNHAVHLRGGQLSKSEKEYLAGALLIFYKTFEDKKMEVADIYLSAFISGIVYAGAYLGPGAADDDGGNAEPVIFLKRTEI